MMGRRYAKMRYSEFTNMPNPFLLRGMKEALERIIKAVNEREKIVIYGYYDLDGITAVSLLMLVLKYLNADVEYVVSDDINEGFSINSEIVENHIKFLGASLIITVGCGINSAPQVELCRKLEIDVIITDYHKYDGDFPQTVVIDPNQDKCTYPFKDLTAVGIAYKLSQAVSTYYQMKCISKYLDLVMLGTLSRSNLVNGENKFIVNSGIYHLNYTNNYGCKALLKVYKIVNINKESIYRLANNIIPSMKNTVNNKRFVDNARIAVELFTTNNMDRAEQIAKYLKNEIEGNKVYIL